MSCRSIRPRDAMPHIHLDAVGGIAGDMFVAALLDAFPDFRSRVLADARAVLPAGYEGQLRETRSGILRGLGFGLAGETPVRATITTMAPAASWTWWRRIRTARAGGRIGGAGGRHPDPHRRGRSRRSIRSRSRRCISTKSPTGIRCSTSSRPAASPPRCRRRAGRSHRCPAAAAWSKHSMACCRSRPPRPRHC